MQNRNGTISCGKRLFRPAIVVGKQCVVMTKERRGAVHDSTCMTVQVVVQPAVQPAVQRAVQPAASCAASCAACCEATHLATKFWAHKCTAAGERRLSRASRLSREAIPFIDLRALIQT
jgi:hypothetical protein